VTDQRTYGLGHRAECGCGWASSWCDDPADAEAAGVDHREVAVGPGDRLDRVMSELLDLQGRPGGHGGVASRELVGRPARPGHLRP
jgi:hypothetical protein